MVFTISRENFTYYIFCPSDICNKISIDLNLIHSAAYYQCRKCDATTVIIELILFLACNFGNQCRNNAQCVTDTTIGVGYRCVCPARFTGTFCETRRL